MNLYGKKVMVVPDQPKMQLSPECPVTPEFREEINEWLRDFFGYHPPTVKDGEFFEVRDRIWVNAKTFESMKTSLKQTGDWE